MTGIEVVRDSNLTKGDSTDGITRMRAFESEGVLVSRSRVEPGVVSGWHHHGTRHLYGFLVSGHLQLEYSLNGTHKVTLRAGDFFHIPVGLVHRDLNPDKDCALVVVNVLAGKGPAVVNVEAPPNGA
jgi:uncharacterized RmlC-like cupin family protein